MVFRESHVCPRGDTLQTHTPRAGLHLASHRRDRVLAYQGGHGRGYLPRVDEPPIVVGNRKELTYLLSQAAELEHAVMCQYLYAAFSLKTAPDEHLTEEQLAAVERWRRVILGVAAEEMLHWALVQNLLTAVGSAPYVSRPYMPHQAKGYPPGVQFRLLPFGEAALRHFVYLERPEGMELADAEGFETGRAVAAADGRRRGHPARPGVRHPGSPVPLRRAGLRPAGRVAGRGRAVHRARRSIRQTRPPSGGRTFVPITDLAGANRALERIVEQGEGATGDWRDRALRPLPGGARASTWRCAMPIPASSPPIRSSAPACARSRTSSPTSTSPTPTPAAARTCSTPPTS